MTLIQASSSHPSLLCAWRLRLGRAWATPFPRWSRHRPLPRPRARSPRLGFGPRGCGDAVCEGSPPTAKASPIPKSSSASGRPVDSAVCKGGGAEAGGRPLVVSRARWQARSKARVRSTEATIASPCSLATTGSAVSPHPKSLTHCSMLSPMSDEYSSRISFLSQAIGDKTQSVPSARLPKVRTIIDAALCGDSI